MTVDVVDDDPACRTPRHRPFVAAPEVIGIGRGKPQSLVVRFERQ
jgi:hypothetical protein